MRGLHKDPARRFQTAKEMSDALERAAPPVTRSTVSNWVLENAPDEIQRREECVARVESTMTPVPATSLAPPPGMSTPPAGDSTLSRMGSLSQSVTPDAPADGSRWSLRKRLLLAVAVALTIALAGLTPALLRAPPPPGNAVAALPVPPANAPEPVAAKPAVPPEKPEAEKPTPPPASSQVSEAAEAAPEPSPAAQSQSSRRRGTSTSSSKRSRSKGGAFDRIYRRD
jgi:hypothetical protein